MQNNYNLIKLIIQRSSVNSDFEFCLNNSKYHCYIIQNKIIKYYFNPNI